MDLASTLPEISPNYKPLPYINPMNRKEEDKALTDVIYVKNQRYFFIKCKDVQNW